MTGDEWIAHIKELLNIKKPMAKADLVQLHGDEFNAMCDDIKAGWSGDIVLPYNDEAYLTKPIYKV